MPTDRQRMHTFFREQRRDWREQMRSQSARRSRNQVTQGPLPLILIGIGAALYFAFPLIVALLIYGTFSGMMMGTHRI